MDQYSYSEFMQLINLDVSLQVKVGITSRPFRAAANDLQPRLVRFGASGHFPISK